MEGFGGETSRPSPRDLDDFPLFMERLRQQRGRRNRIANPPKAIGAVHYTSHGLDQAKAENDLFKSALGRAGAETRRDLHDLGVARHHRHHDGQRALDSYEAYVFALAAYARNTS